jgi:CDGSH-type Zn-finger protein
MLRPYLHARGSRFRPMVDSNEVKITVKPNGSLRVAGKFDLVDADGNVIELPEGWDPDRELTLCRCGESAIKPFCDSTHKTIDWSPETRAER